MHLEPKICAVDIIANIVADQKTFYYHDAASLVGELPLIGP